MIGQFQCSKSRTRVQKSVTTVQKSVTTEDPIKLDGGKREFLKGKWQQKFLLSHLKETLKVIYKRLLQNFYICFTLADIVT